MPIFYCPADGQGPRNCPDWAALYHVVGPTDEDRAPIDDMRAAEPGHVASNGNGPRTSTMNPRDTAAILALRGVERGSTADEHGGHLAYLAGDEVVGRQLLCPVCLAPVRVVG